MNRFRPSIVLAGTEPYAEDTWNEARIGGARLGAAKPCGRCQVTTTDQSTGEVVGPEPLATLSTYRESPEFGVMFGMNYVSRGCSGRSALSTGPRPSARVTTFRPESPTSSMP